MGCGASRTNHWETERVSGFKELTLQRIVVNRGTITGPLKISLSIKDADSSQVLTKAQSVHKLGDIAKRRKTLKLTINAEPDVIH